MEVYPVRSERMVTRKVWREEIWSTELESIAAVADLGSGRRYERRVAQVRGGLVQVGAAGAFLRFFVNAVHLSNIHVCFIPPRHRTEVITVISTVISSCLGGWQRLTHPPPNMSLHGKFGRNLSGRQNS